MHYNRQAIIADTLSLLAGNPRTPKFVLLIWEEQMERLLGRPYRITGMSRSRFLADAEPFIARCAEMKADPFRVIFAIFSHARWMRTRTPNHRYKPFPSQLKSVRIFTWWQQWEKHELIMAGHNPASLMEQTSASVTSNRTPPRLQSPNLRKILVAGIGRLLAYHQQYPRLETAMLLESYSEQLPRIIRWALGDTAIILSEMERRFLDSLSEREFLRTQLLRYDPQFRLPNHRD